MKLKNTAILIAVIWILIIAIFVGSKEYNLYTGTIVKMKTLPIDPTDLFRGEYVILKYDISTVNLSEFNQKPIEGDNVCYQLLIENGYAIKTSKILKETPKEGLFICGKITYIEFDKANIDYGIESYFVPENKGQDVQNMAGKNLDAQIVIDKYGNAQLSSLFLNGTIVTFN